MPRRYNATAAGLAQRVVDPLYRDCGPFDESRFVDTNAIEVTRHIVHENNSDLVTIQFHTYLLEIVTVARQD